MAFSEQDVQRVWEKGTAAPSNDPNEWRKDECTAWMNRKAYGGRNSSYGWEIDHIVPITAGGSDAISNLRLPHWKNNAEKQGGRLTCPVKSSGNTNVGVCRTRVHQSMNRAPRIHQTRQKAGMLAFALVAEKWLRAPTRELGCCWW